MSKRISGIVRGALALLVAAGLTSGATAALAAPDPRPLCPYAPEYGQIAQACSSSAVCLEACTAWWGGWNPGFCGDDGCCVCMI